MMKKTVLAQILLSGALCLMLATAVLAQPVAGKGFVNVRELAESMGLNYRWFPMQKAVVLSRDGKTMRLEINQTDCQVGNTVITLPAPPLLEDGEVMVPARAVMQVFGTPGANPRPPPPEPPSREPENPAPPRVVVTPPPAQPTPPRIVPAEEEEGDDGIKLVSVRHSVREDHTRVVLEFDGPVSHRLERAGPGKYKLRIDGCLNVIPTKRSNPVGRDVKAISFNSGANRQGLVVTIDAPEFGGMPTIETVGNPFRMVVAVRGVAEAPATATATLAASAPIIVPAAGRPASATVQVTPSPARVATASVAAKPPEKPAEKPPAIVVEKPPALEIPSLNATATPKPEVEETYEVALATLTRPIFAGRTIIIDPGHGGRELGVAAPDLPPEKQITLSIALKMRQMLKRVGLNALVIRTQDTDLSQAERQALANRSAGDLLISLHVGGSTDDTVEGVACYAYDPGGVSFEHEAVGKLSPQMVFQEWTQSYRFDLAKFLAGKIRGRLVEQVRLKDRGVRSLPLAPLRFLTMPAILVETGVLTHPVEGRRLAGANYQDAVAKAMTNGVLDFFNSIRLNN